MGATPSARASALWALQPKCMLLISVSVHDRTRKSGASGRSAMHSIRGFGAAVGQDSSCHRFGRHPGICVVRCESPFKCDSALAACSGVRPHCVGVSLNKEGTLATLKARLEWVAAPPSHVQNASWWRLSECRDVVRKAKKLARQGTSTGGPQAHRGSWTSSRELKLLGLWRAALCDEYTRGPMLGTLPHGLRKSAVPPPQPLVMDVGFADGADSAMFLRRGYRVIAVEASASTIMRARTRHPVIGVASSGGWEGRLLLENVAIAERAGSLTFYSPAGDTRSHYG